MDDSPSVFGDVNIEFETKDIPKKKIYRTPYNKSPLEIQLYKVQKQANSEATVTVIRWLKPFKQFREGCLTCSCAHWKRQRRDPNDRICVHTENVSSFLSGMASLRVNEYKKFSFNPDLKDGRMDALLETMIDEDRL